MRDPKIRTMDWRSFVAECDGVREYSDGVAALELQTCINRGGSDGGPTAVFTLRTLEGVCGELVFETCGWRFLV
jgi:hypothetical protein